LGFVALNPTYILPVLFRNAKPNNGRIQNRTPKVSISIRLAAFQARGAARMKLHKSDAVPRSISPQSSLRAQRLFNFFFSAFSHRGVGPMPYGPEAAISAVNYYVSFLIRLAAF
jgi:hypothetical protein